MRLSAELERLCRMQGRNVPWARRVADDLAAEHAKLLMLDAGRPFAPNAGRHVILAGER